MRVNHPIISADSHITEAPDTYTAYIDPKYRDIAPRIVETEDRGDIYVIDGMKSTIPMGLVAAAGQKWNEIDKKARYGDLHRSGWDSSVRIADQDRDGISAEIIYPTVGMVLCNHPDFEYKAATMAAYNRWVAEYASVDTDRLIPLGQTAMQSPEQGIADLEAMKALGIRGVMMPGNPQVEDYDSPVYDEFWAACVDLELIPSYHILTNSADRAPTRGPKMNGFMQVMRGVQDVMGMLVLGGVFERNPQLKVVCAEADAGWVPHYMYRMDHTFERHRGWLPAQVDKRPSGYFAEHIYLTFQDDFVAFENAAKANWERLCWANDFPHSDSTWPWSQPMLTDQTAHLTDEQVRGILCDNIAELYGIDTSALPVGGDALAGAA